MTLIVGMKIARSKSFDLLFNKGDEELEFLTYDIVRIIMDDAIFVVGIVVVAIIVLTFDLSVALRDE